MFVKYNSTTEAYHPLIAAFLETTIASLRRMAENDCGGALPTPVHFLLEELPQLPKDMNILHIGQLGRVYTLIVRGNPSEIKSRMAAYSPILLEALPLSLEEIFIYELGGEDYAVRDIVL